MKVIFRADASLAMGTGHVIRCLTLAQVLKDNGAKVEFICREHHGNLIDKIRSSGFNVHGLEVFERTKINDLQLIVAGDTSSEYGRNTLSMIEKSHKRDKIKCLGYITQAQKQELLRRSHLVLVTSIKEGWGLIVTEANSQGTPAIVYNVDGLRDSTIDNETGIITNTNTPDALAESIFNLLKNKQQYNKLCKSGWSFSKKVTFDRSYSDFKRVIDNI